MAINHFLLGYIFDFTVEIISRKNYNIIPPENLSKFHVLQYCQSILIVEE